MALGVVIGVCFITLAGYALARPMSVWSFATPRQWEADPYKARQEQRIFMNIIAVFLILSGLILIATDLLGTIP